MKKIVMILIFASSSAFAKMPIPNHPLEKAMYCYWLAGATTSWAPRTHARTVLTSMQQTFLINGGDITSASAPNLNPSVQNSAALAVLATHRDRSLDIGPKAGTILFGYWDQINNVHKQIIYDVDNLPCLEPATATKTDGKKSCTKLVRIKVSEETFFVVRFETNEFRPGTNEFTRNAFFLTTEELESLRGTDLTIPLITKTKTRRSFRVSDKLIARANDMLDKKFPHADPEDMKVAKGFDNYCAVQEIRSAN